MKGGGGGRCKAGWDQLTRWLYSDRNGWMDQRSCFAPFINRKKKTSFRISTCNLLFLKFIASERSISSAISQHVSLLPVSGNPKCSSVSEVTMHMNMLYHQQIMDSWVGGEHSQCWIFCIIWIFHLFASETCQRNCFLRVLDLLTWWDVCTVCTSTQCTHSRFSPSWSRHMFISV